MDDSPWDDDPTYKEIQNTEWSKLSNDFTNAGYREGITVGKESALQEGFNEGFASVGVPLGRKVGYGRGRAAALVGILTSRGKESQSSEKVEVVRDLVNQLSSIDITSGEKDEIELRVDKVREEVELLAEEIISQCTRDGR